MPKWIIDEESETSKEVLIAVQSDSTLARKWPAFVRDVTENPFYHPKHRRIAKLRGNAYPPGTYRYRKDPLRVIYYPERETNTVYPLEAASGKNISYKKRST